jgi:hypothetical protein
MHLIRELLPKFSLISTLCFIMVFVLDGCVKPYLLPRSAHNLNYLVVDGAIIIGDTSTIKLSRTLNISDTLPPVPERNAEVSIVAQSGNTFGLQAQGDGIYKLNTTTLSFSEKYSLHIRTSNGSEYISDFVESKQSPPIDSLEWDQDDAISIYVNTHDSSGNTRYYRWEFEETGQYTAEYDSHLDFRNGELVFIEPQDYRFTCYKYFNSNAIVVGSSRSLKDDVIRRGLITMVPNDNSKIAVRYTILVKQFALTAGAYKYYQLIKNNSEQTANIFDPQPSQLQGNIHCLTNPGEQVLGYMTASSVTEKRIFINQVDLKYRKQSIYASVCEVILLNDSASIIEFLSTGRFLPAYYQGSGTLAIAAPICVDCRLQGGTVGKPSYWQ